MRHSPSSMLLWVYSKFFLEATLLTSFSDVLEASAIAWPNAAMWRQVNLVGPYIAQQQQSPRKASSELELHGHSPRRNSGVARAKQPGRSQTGMPPPSNPFPRTATTFDPFTDQIHSAFTGWRQASGNDVSMPDYSSSSGHTRANSTRQVTDPMSITGETLLQDSQFDVLVEAMGTRPPANTPQNGENVRTEMPIPFPAVAARKTTPRGRDTPRPSGDFTIVPSAATLVQEQNPDADSFAAAINQAVTTAGAVKSRKENINRSPVSTRASSSTAAVEDEATRNVSATFTAINSGTNNKRQRVVTPAAAKAIDDEDEPRSSPSTRKVSRTSAKDGQAQGTRRILSNVTNV